MKWFKELFQSIRRKACYLRPQAPLFLESLEMRLAPASVSVVPVTQPADSTHFYSLEDAARAAQLTGNGGLVTIEPGALGGQASIPGSITIQGDPNVPPSVLPSYLIRVGDFNVHDLGVTSNVTLTNLNLSSLSVGVPNPGFTSGASNIVVSKCLIGNLTAQRDVSSIYSENTVTGSAVFELCNDVIANNGFIDGASAMAGGTMLFMDESTGVVTQNSFYSSLSSTAIDLHNCSGAFFFFAGNPPISISNNTITLVGLINTAISVRQDGTNPNVGVSDVKILNNTCQNTGAGLLMEMTTGDNAHFRAYVEGNDFHKVGVAIVGDGTAAGNIDLGGGALGSRGGNNFRGFTAQATASAAAISLTNAPQGSVTAQQCIFTPGISPSSVVYAPDAGSMILVDQPLSDQRAFVQTLYNEALGRTGALAELDLWINLLNTQGQAAVANGILHSTEALGHIVDSFYLRFLGRQSEAGGKAEWIIFLQQGGTLEAVESLFLTSPEYINHINVDFVQSLYLNLLGRSGSREELAGWNNNIQSLGLAGVASAFVQSSECRLSALRSYFQTFLHRTPTNEELTSLANSSLDLLALEEFVLSSQEFFVNG
jgi:hypothetical protein